MAAVVGEPDSDGRWSYWTWGGPNSGEDFGRTDDEKPIFWTDGDTAVAALAALLRPREVPA